MPYFTAQTTTSTALANNAMIAEVVPAAAANFHITSIVLGVTTTGNTITDFDLSVGLNRATTRVGTPAAVTINRTDPNSAAPLALVDSSASTGAISTLAASDGWLWSYNSRGALPLNFQLYDIVSTVGTANPLVFLNRSGAALPALHSITLTVEWLE